MISSLKFSRLKTPDLPNHCPVLKRNAGSGEAFCAAKSSIRQRASRISRFQTSPSLVPEYQHRVLGYPAYLLYHIFPGEVFDHGSMVRAVRTDVHIPGSTAERTAVIAGTGRPGRVLAEAWPKRHDDGRRAVGRGGEPPVRRAWRPCAWGLRETPPGSASRPRPSRSAHG